MIPTDKRRLNYLWERRHDPFDDSDLQTQINVINNTITKKVDDVGVGSGAYIHLNASVDQAIAAAGTDIEWAGTWKTPFEFADPPAPTTTIPIPKAGYYDLKVELGWSTFNGGGSVAVSRVRSGVTTQIYPSASEPGVWSTSAGSLFVETAKALRLEVDDELKVTVSHTATSETLASAVLVIELIDRFGVSAPSSTSTIVFTLGSTADDGRTTNNATLFWTDWPSVGDGWTGWLRFPNVTIPQGATITSAFLTAYTTQADTDCTPDGDINAKIYGIDEDNHTAPTTLGEWSTDHGIHTTAAVDWDFACAKVDGLIRITPNIASIIQEIVDRVGWSSGNAIGFHIDNDGTSGRRQSFEHQESGFNQQMTLTVDWEA